MKLLITGGAGFIGSNFIYYWLRKHPKDKLRVFDALTFAGNYETLKPIEKKIEFIHADINDRPKVKSAMKGVDAVVHFAAESHVERSIFDPTAFWRTNVTGTLTLLEEAEKAKVPRFHHVSTDEVYGELALDSKDRFSEKTPYAPRADNLYAISKAEADRMVRNFSKESKTHITISNCSNNYGPFQFPEKYIPIVITNLIDDMKAPVHGDGLNTRDWIHTEDHASAIDLILEKGKHTETYLIGSDNDRTNKFIAERVVDLYGKDRGWIRHVPDRHSNDRRYAIDATKIQKELGWKPQVPREKFDDGLKETIDWYRKNEGWWRPLLKRRASLTNGEGDIEAFVILDREAGKVKYSYKGVDKAVLPQEEVGLEQKILKDTGKLKFIKKKLKSRGWFKASRKSIREELISLTKDPNTHGFVEDLANRPDSLGNVKLIKILRLTHAPEKYGIYGIVAWFLVRTAEGQEKAEGIYSWAFGPKSGAKLLVLLKHRNKITHLALLKNEKFPIGAKVYDLVGGFPRFNESVFEMITRQLYEDLGIVGSGSIKIGEIIGLGRVAPDAGMTNNHPFIYAVIMELADKVFPPINIGEIYEEEGEIVLWPVERLSELVNKVDDAYFLSALTRVILGGVGNINLRVA